MELLTANKCSVKIEKKACDTSKLNNQNVAKIGNYLEKVLEKDSAAVGDTVAKRDSTYTETMGGYNGQTNTISICSNMPQELVDVTLTHELIHAYDHCTGRLDGIPWTSLNDEGQSEFSKRSCQAIIKSEIRAANLSGDCDWIQELFRGQLAWKSILTRNGDWKEKCIKRRALLSINLSRSQCLHNHEEIVDQSFPDAVQDIDPFLHV